MCLVKYQITPHYKHQNQIGNSTTQTEFGDGFQTNDYRQGGTRQIACYLADLSPYLINTTV